MNLLLTTSSSSFSSSLSLTTQLSQSTVANPSQLVTVHWFEKYKDIIHWEFYDKWIPYLLAFILARIPRKLKKLLPSFLQPHGKTGIRARSSSSTAMDQYIRKSFVIENDRPTEDKTREKFKIGLFVYMWVKPKWRGQHFGDYLLNYGKLKCRERGDEYMLLIHDDDGSGKLVQYYLQRGFKVSDELLDKSMICQL